MTATCRSCARCSVECAAIARDSSQLKEEKWPVCSDQPAATENVSNRTTPRTTAALPLNAPTTSFQMRHRIEREPTPDSCRRLSVARWSQGTMDRCKNKTLPVRYLQTDPQEVFPVFRSPNCPVRPWPIPCRYQSGMVLFTLHTIVLHNTKYLCLTPPETECRPK